MSVSVHAEDDLHAERWGASRTRGVARPCRPYAGEVAHSRVVTSDGQDFVVATALDVRAGEGYLVGAYPVSRGYLLMMRQPLMEAHCAQLDVALERHDQLVAVLVEAGPRVVRARTALQARARADQRAAQRLARHGASR